MTPTALRIAMISVHSSPLGPLGTQDTGGMSVYIRELAREMGRRGHRVDIFTGAGETADPPLQRLHPNVRLVRLSLGPGRHAPKAELHAHLSRFALALHEFRGRTAAEYDLIHSHYWLSGRVGEDVRAGWGLPHIVTFHTLGAVKDALFGPGAESSVRIAAERELAAACDRVVVTSAREKENLVRYYSVDPYRVRVVPCGVDHGPFPTAGPAGGAAAHRGGRERTDRAVRRAVRPGEGGRAAAAGVRAAWLPPGRACAST